MMSHVNLDSSVLKRLSKATTQEEAVGLLVERIQTVGLPQVGRDCISVVIPPPATRQVSVEFHAISTRVGAVVDRQLQPLSLRFAVAFSPWVISPAVEHPPSVFLGDWHLCLGEWTVRMAAPYNPTSGIDSAISTQRRKGPPKHS
jgi:hypothetical protein